ncbi:MAG: exo-alpha-sialidase [Kouleothrix sp.]|nr:exo-alpha-sialidase [Kouleothrix sp.]
MALRKRPRTFRIVSGVLALLLLAAGVGGVAWRLREAREGPEGESLTAFAREHRFSRTLPLAVMREKLERGGEASREIIAGPAQEDYANRAFPNSYIDYAQARGALAAYQSVDRRTLQAAASATLDARDARTRGVSWKEIGPFTPVVPAEVTYTGRATTDSGRVTALALAPGCAEQSCTLLVGAAGGGVWRSDNALAAKPAWQPSSTGLASNAIGSIEFDPTDASGKTIYLGTGEPNGSSDSEAGVGLYKSTDGGNSWALVPSSVAVSKDRSIASIVIDPANPSHIYIGTAVARHGSSSVNGGRFTPPNAPQIGVYESTDGGASFTLTFSQESDVVDPGSANGNDFFRGGISKIALDPADASTVYVTVFDYGIWRRSPALDGDAAFHQVFAPIAPNGIGERVEIAVTSKDSKTRIYAGIGSDEVFDDSERLVAAATFWRIDDAGKPAADLLASQDGPGGWENLSSAESGTPGYGSFDFCGGQCSYDMPVASPPGRPDDVWIGGQMQYGEIFTTNPPSNGRAVQRSTNAGVSFTDMTNDTQSPPLGMHPDQHAIVFVPVNPDIAFVGSDGGVVRTSGTYVDRSSDCDSRGLAGADLINCKGWLAAIPERIFSLNDGLRTLQFQSVSVNQRNAGGDVMGGTQDNGTWAYSGSPTWFESVGGDGGQSGVDIDHPNTRMHTYYGPSPDVNFHGTDVNSWLWTGDPLYLSGEASSFYVPLINDPKVGDTWFIGLQHVWRTKDSGGDKATLEAHCNELTGDFTVICGDWEPIGQDLSGADFGADKGGSAPAGNYIVANERARADKGTLWAATRRGRLFISKNADGPTASVTFTRIDTAAQPQRFVSGIVVDRENPNHAWVSFSGYDAYTPTTPGHVFEVTYNPASGTASWKNLSYDLGDQPITDVARDHTTGDLYASADFGVLRLPAGGSSWNTAAPGLPPVAVYGLTTSPQSRVLYAATHGRGAWRLRLADM